MHRKTFLVLTLSAWLLAAGSPWDLVQTFGWGRMFATYARSMPVLQALDKTFSGEAPCGVCEFVEHTREQRDAAGSRIPGPKTPEKILFVSAVRALVFASPAQLDAGRVSEAPVPAGTERAAPPLPPPRLAA